jgi:hypothetical protein
MLKQVFAGAVVLGLVVAVPVVRADNPIEGRAKDAKDHYEDGYAATKSVMLKSGTHKLSGNKQRTINHESNIVVKDGKVQQFVVKDTKTGKAVKTGMVKSTKNPFKASARKGASCGGDGDEHVVMGDEGDCNANNYYLWYGYYYYNPYTTYYVYYWYPSYTVYIPPTYTYPIYDYTSYIVY